MTSRSFFLLKTICQNRMILCKIGNKAEELNQKKDDLSSKLKKEKRKSSTNHFSTTKIVHYFRGAELLSYMRHWVPSRPFQHYCPNILCPLRMHQGHTDVNKRLQRILLHYYEFTRAWALAWSHTVVQCYHTDRVLRGVFNLIFLRGKGTGYYATLLTFLKAHTVSATALSHSHLTSPKP